MKKSSETKEVIQHFSLQGVLPEGHTLAIDTNNLVAAIMIVEHGKPRMHKLASFTDMEMLVFLPLISSHPYYAPYEDLYASYTWGTTEKRDDAREILNAAQEINEWDFAMRPLRNVLSRTRLKTRQLGIEISSILETGYIIMGLFERRRKG